MCDFFSQSIAAATKITCINLLCCTLSKCNTLCEKGSSFLLNTGVVSSTVEHVMFAKIDKLHCKVPHGI